MIEILILLVVVVWIYNLLVKDRNQMLAAWSDIDVQLKRRHDLIPQLVTAVKLGPNNSRRYSPHWKRKRDRAIIHCATQVFFTVIISAHSR